MKRLFFVLLASVALSSTACSHFKHGKKPKVSKTIAADMEEVFKQRWVAKRISEITAAEPNIEPREARRRAVSDFKVRFSHTSVAKQADAIGERVP